ncbi:MAG TPA: hypothetical protein VGC66_05780 [Pyrinomonadaceae bacterium]
MNRLAIILLTIILGAVGMVIGASKNKRSAVNSKTIPAQQDAPDIIDGAKNPGMIPDRVAYALLLRLIANRQTEEEKGRIRAYIRQLGIGKPCCGQNPSLGTQETDIDALITLAEEFQQRVTVLDEMAKEIRDKNRLEQNAVTKEKFKNQLKKLQKQKERIIDETIALLPARLSESGMKKVRQHVKERVKLNAKLRLSSN